MFEAPISIDVAEVGPSDPDPSKETELRLRLEEKYPCDPDQWSGVTLLLNQSGDYTIMAANIGYDDASCELNNGSHCLGSLQGRPVREFLQKAVALVRDYDGVDSEIVTLDLKELYYSKVTNGLSGAQLRYSGHGRDAELTLCFGSHCFGAARGSILWKWLNVANARASMDDCIGADLNDGADRG
jgi:hypothetical protein